MRKLRVAVAKLLTGELPATFDEIVFVDLGGEVTIRHEHNEGAEFTGNESHHDGRVDSVYVAAALMIERTAALGTASTKQAIMTHE